MTPWLLGYLAVGLAVWPWIARSLYATEKTITAARAVVVSCALAAVWPVGVVGVGVWQALLEPAPDDDAAESRRALG